jgi:hypothetical protein
VALIVATPPESEIVTFGPAARALVDKDALKSVTPDTSHVVAVNVAVARGIEFAGNAVIPVTAVHPEHVIVAALLWPTNRVLPNMYSNAVPLADVPDNVAVAAEKTVVVLPVLAVPAEIANTVEFVRVTAKSEVLPAGTAQVKVPSDAISLTN